MAQGKFKKSKLKVPAQKDKRKQKVGMKKGNFNIVPKKLKLQEAAKLKRNLEKGIKACIEDQLTAKTIALEPRSLSMLKPSTSQKGKPNKS